MAVAAPLRGVILDMDGVIVDSTSLHNDAWRAYMQGLGMPCEDIESRMYGRRNDEIVLDFFGGHLTAAEIFEHGARKERLYREMMAARLETSLIPGVMGFLERHAGASKAVASNAEPENVNFVLDGLALRRHFEVIIDGMQVERPKPHPDIYARAARMLNVEPENCIVFEDSPIGIEAARSAGARVVGIESRAPVSGVDLRVQDFTRPELEAWLSAQTATGFRG